MDNKSDCLNFEVNSIQSEQTNNEFNSVTHSLLGSPRPNKSKFRPAKKSSFHNSKIIRKNSLCQEHEFEFKNTSVGSCRNINSYTVSSTTIDSNNEEMPNTFEVNSIQSEQTNNEFNSETHSLLGSPRPNKSKFRPAKISSFNISKIIRKNSLCQEHEFDFSNLSVESSRKKMSNTMSSKSIDTNNEEIPNIFEFKEAKED